MELSAPLWVQCCGKLSAPCDPAEMLAGEVDAQRACSPYVLFPTADEVEAKSQEVSMCLEDIMEKLRSAFPNSRGTRVKSPSLASYCSLR